MEKNETEIRLLLSGSLLKRFNMIKNHYGYKTNTSLLILLINDHYKQLIGDDGRD